MAPRRSGRLQRAAWPMTSGPEGRSMQANALLDGEHRKRSRGALKLAATGEKGSGLLSRYEPHWHDEKHSEEAQ